MWDFVLWDTVFSIYATEQHSFEIEIFCNTVNVFTVTFNQLNVFLN